MRKAFFRWGQNGNAIDTTPGNIFLHATCHKPFVHSSPGDGTYETLRSQRWDGDSVNVWHLLRVPLCCHVQCFEWGGVRIRLLPFLYKVIMAANVSTLKLGRPQDLLTMRGSVDCVHYRLFPSRHRPRTVSFVRALCCSRKQEAANEVDGQKGKRTKLKLMYPVCMLLQRLRVFLCIVSLLEVYSQVLPLDQNPLAS